MPHKNSGDFESSELDESEQRYKQLLAAVTSYRYTVRLKQGIPVATEHTAGCLGATGYGPEDYARDPCLWFSMIHPDDRARVNQHLQQVLAGQAVPPIEHRILHRDGTTRWIRDTILLHHDEHGALDQYDGLVEDITDRKEADELFRQLIESAPDAIVIVDQEGKITLVNAQAERLFAYPRDELLGEPIEILVPDRCRAVHRGQRAGYMAAPRSRPLDVELGLCGRRKDGSEFPAEITLSPLKTDQQLLVFTAIRDVSERKRMEQLLLANEARMLAAQRIQARLLPQTSPDVPGLDVSGAVWPAELVAGDYFDCFHTDDGTVIVAVGDVSGHGLGPALLTAFTHAIVRALSRMPVGLDDILRSVNTVLVEDKTEQFVTLLLGRVSPKTRELAYLNAGHPTGYVLDRGGNVKARLESQTVPLGTSVDTAFPTPSSVRLEPGDVVLFVSDGILEAMGPAGEPYGIDRLLATVGDLIGRPARQVVAGIGSAVSRFVADQPPRDDMTVLVLKVE
jgi:sigma-B regulation protein RsbU (phosphoserine phosphatase)